MQDLLPGFAAQEAQSRAVAQSLDRRQRVADHLHSLAICWPQWDGPKVGGRCEVHGCVVHSLTHNALRYHFLAPCIILEISEDRETIIAQVDYRPGSTCEHHNGERLRLDITDVWAPVSILHNHR